MYRCSSSAVDRDVRGDGGGSSAGRARCGCRRRCRRGCRRGGSSCRGASPVDGRGPRICSRSVRGCRRAGCGWRGVRRGRRRARRGGVRGAGRSGWRTTSPSRGGSSGSGADRRGGAFDLGVVDVVTCSSGSVQGGEGASRSGLWRGRAAIGSAAATGSPVPWASRLARSSTSRRSRVGQPAVAVVVVVGGRCGWRTPCWSGGRG